MPLVGASSLSTDGFPSKMERVKRTVLDPEQAFEEVYKSLVRRNQDLFLNESRTGVKKRMYCAISARPSSTFSAAQENGTDDSMHNLEFNLKNSESVVERHACHRTTVSPRPEYLDSPAATPLNLTTKTVADIKLQIEHKRSLVIDVEDCESAAWTSKIYTKEASNFSEEPLYLETSDSEDESAKSGQSHININEDVCKECLGRYHKTLKDPSASIKEPDIVDPNHWSCNYWMMSNGVRRKSVNQEKRDFLTLLKYLRAHAQLSNVKSTTRPRRCSRPHVFLQRNLKSSRRSRWNSSSMKPKGREKDKEKCPRDLLKSNTGKKFNCSLELGKEKNKQLFVYKVDRVPLTKDNIKESQTEDYDGTVTIAKKKQMSRDQGTEDEQFAQRSNSSRIHDMSSGSRPKLKNVIKNRNGNSMEILRSESRESHLAGDFSSDSIVSIVGDSEEESSELNSDGDSSPFGWVSGGSFREMLAKMSSRPSSKVVREYSGAHAGLQQF